MTPTISTRDMGVTNAGGYAFNEYTVTVTLDTATLGDLVISKTVGTKGAGYVPSITIE